MEAVLTTNYDSHPIRSYLGGVITYRLIYCRLVRPATLTDRLRFVWGADLFVGHLPLIKTALAIAILCDEFLPR